MTKIAVMVSEILTLAEYEEEKITHLASTLALYRNNAATEWRANTQRTAEKEYIEQNQQKNGGECRFVLNTTT